MTTINEASKRLDLFNKHILDDVQKARAVYTSVKNVVNAGTLEDDVLEAWQNTLCTMEESLEAFGIGTSPIGKDDPSRDMVFYDKSQYTRNLPTYTTLNKDNLSYVDLLRYVILPQFHPLPAAEIQYDILTAAMMCNSNALPDDVLNTRYYIYGQSGSGKTTLCKRWQTHYYKHCRCTWMQGSTGTQLAESIHTTVYVDGSLDTQLYLRPGLAILNNIYSDLQRRLQHQYSILLATELENAFYSRKGQDAGTFYTHSTIVLNGLDTPTTLYTFNPELVRRVMPFCTEKITPKRKIGAYSWQGVADEYRKTWHNENIGKFYKVLSEVAGIPNDSSACISPEQFECSRNVLATGVFIGLWADIAIGITALELYWQYVNNVMLKSNSDPLYVLLTSFLEDDWATLQKRTAIRHLPVSYVLDYLRDKSKGIVPSNDATIKRTVAFFTQRGYSVERNSQGLVFSDGV